MDPGCWEASRHPLEDVGVGVTPAGPAKLIAREVGERLLDLGEIAPPDPLPTAITDAATLGDALGGHDVGTMLVGGEAPAFATVALGAGADANLLQRVRLGPGRGDEAAGALVGGEDLVRVELEETEAPEDVGWFGGGGVLHLRYSCVDQEMLLLVRVPGSFHLPRGRFAFAPLLYNICTIYARTVHNIL